LGVRYVLEGSVQKAEDRIRINAQLIDALTGRHLWAERYNRKLTDLFALQDDITIKILTAIRIKLTSGEEASTYEKHFKGEKGLDCYLKYLEGVNNIHTLTVDSSRAARRIAEEMMGLCPQNPMTHILTSWVTYLEYWFGLGKSPQESVEKGIESAQRAVAMDDSLSFGHRLLGIFYPLKREYERAIAEAERSLALEPGTANAHMVLGISLISAGRSEEAISPLQKAIRLDPIGTTLHFVWLGNAYRYTGRLEEAVSEYKKALQRAPNNFFAHIGLAAAYSMMGREQEAHAAAVEVLRINPKFSLDSFAKKLTNKDQSKIDQSVEALRKAGLK